MVQLVWQDAFESGDSVIDEKHRQLFTMGNEMVERAMQRPDHQVSLEEFDRISSHIALHFKEEMEIIEQNGYPSDELAHHKAEHERLLERVGNLRELVVKNQVGIMDVVTMLIQEVVLGHMVVEDMKFFPYLSKG